jgi:hypothetical protein
MIMLQGSGIIGRAGIKPTILPIPSRSPVLGVLAVTIEDELSNQQSSLDPLFVLNEQCCRLGVAGGSIATRFIITARRTW